MWAITPTCINYKPKGMKKVWMIQLGSIQVNHFVTDWLESYYQVIWAWLAESDQCVHDLSVRRCHCHVVLFTQGD